MADVALHDVDRLVEDLVDRQRHGRVDRLDALGRGRRLLGDQQLERIQRHGHVAREDLEELQVALAERPGLGALDVERADHLVVQHQRDGQANSSRRENRCRYSGSSVVSSHR